MNFKHILVTGGAGFIGTNFIHRLLQANTNCHITCLDILSYSGKRENLADLESENPESSRFRFVHGDIADNELVTKILTQQSTQTLPIDAVVHFAAESHVDRSIDGPGIFIQANIVGTSVLLECCKKYWTSLESESKEQFRFVHISTDEVYGTLSPTDPPFKETNSLLPNSPYSASKASSDMLVRSYCETYDFPGLITRCSNNYGPYQFPEKLIPLMITRALQSQQLPVYGDGQNIRDWIHVSDHCDGVARVLTHGIPGECYNIGGQCELKNIDLVKTILSLLNKPESLIKYVQDRPGHDRRYAIDNSKINTTLNWQPKITFEDGLNSTIRWYLDNQQWWQSVLDTSSAMAKKMYAS